MGYFFEKTRQAAKFDQKFAKNVLNLTAYTK